MALARASYGLPIPPMTDEGWIDEASPDYAEYKRAMASWREAYLQDLKQRRRRIYILLAAALLGAISLLAPVIYWFPRPTAGAFIPEESGVRYYVLQVLGDVEPLLHGPYGEKKLRDSRAKELRARSDGVDGIFWLNVSRYNRVTVGSYSAAFMEP